MTQKRSKSGSVHFLLQKCEDAHWFKKSLTVFLERFCDEHVFPRIQKVSPDYNNECNLIKPQYRNPDRGDARTIASGTVSSRQESD
jgi:hypothetical protein